MQQPTPEHDLIDIGLSHQQAGRLDEAEVAYRSALQRDPSDADALHLLGLIDHQRGQFDAAIEKISRAVELDPGAASFLHNLGEAQRAAHRFDDAALSFRRAVEIDPVLFESWRSLGLAYQQSGQIEKAINAWERANWLQPGNPGLTNDLGVAHRHCGNSKLAAELFRQVISGHTDGKAPSEAYENLVAALLDGGNARVAIEAARELVAAYPQRAMSHATLANALLPEKEYEQAMLAARDALRLDPNCVGGHFALGAALWAMREYQGALLAFTKCDELKPGMLPVELNIGHVLFGLGLLKRAAEQYRKVLAKDATVYAAQLNLCTALDGFHQGEEAIAESRKLVERWPNDATARNLLATFLSRKGKVTEADEHFHRGLQLNPTDGHLLGNFGLMLAIGGRVEECVAVLRRACKARKDDVVPHSNILLYLNAHPGLTPQAIFEEHRAWGRRFCNALAAAAPPHARGDPEKPKLRIGYVSPDFRVHSVAYFIEPILSSHDRSKFEVVIYDDVVTPDAMTLHLRKFADEWYRVLALNYEQLAAKIREDKIDILVELAGHTANHRLMTLACKPAPIQVTYLGYPNTTGLEAIDYRITDAVADPPRASDQLHVERLVRPSSSFLTFRASAEAPPIGPLPAWTSASITFCSFNAIWKINDPLIELWCRTLKAVPSSRMLIKSTGLDDPSARKRVADAFATNGIGLDRIELLDRAPSYGEHLAIYNRCDIQLDSFPYNGTTTLCEGFWMGVPVVTLAGQSHASRVGASLCHTIGLPDLVANSPEEFVTIAARLAGDLDRLESIRMNMRERMANSPLLDAKGFTRRLEEAYRSMWRAWCNNEPLTMRDAEVPT